MCSVAAWKDAVSTTEGKTVRLQVLLDEDEAARFQRYCDERGFKKSTLAARLIREYLDREIGPAQRSLFRVGEK